MQPTELCDVAVSRFDIYKVLLSLLLHNTPKRSAELNAQNILHPCIFLH
jgi:hypothetical protein